MLKEVLSRWFLTHQRKAIDIQAWQPELKNRWSSRTEYKRNIISSLWKYLFIIILYAILFFQHNTFYYLGTPHNILWSHSLPSPPKSISLPCDASPPPQRTQWRRKRKKPTTKPLKFKLFYSYIHSWNREKDKVVGAWEREAETFILTEQAASVFSPNQ